MIELKKHLLDYQEKGVEKLSKVKVGALYMEMGTGKTLTALELIKRRIDKGKVNHMLWLCPCTVIPDLKLHLREDANISQELLTICGIETLSSSIKTFYKLMDLVMTKECYLIVDESNLVKNPFAIRSRNILRLSEECKYKLILNGTPITKNIADLFAQWQILDWRILGYRSYYSFAANHLEYDEKLHCVRRVLNFDYIMDKISPYVYQVKKDECLTLPKKLQTTFCFDLTQKQRAHYRKTVEDFLSLETLYQMNGQNFKFETLIYRVFTALQQISSGQKITSKVSESMQHERFFEKPEDNPRIEALLYLMWQNFKDDKVIVWCKFMEEIEDVFAALTAEGFKCCQFHGKMSFKKREESIEHFKGDCQVLIANKSCASYGLNLQFCHNAIYYNNDWNWGTKVQSEDRIHRIGQNHDVKIIDLFAEDTLDERILECLSNKENISDRFKNLLKDREKVRKWLLGKEAS